MGRSRRSSQSAASLLLAALLLSLFALRSLLGVALLCFEARGIEERGPTPRFWAGGLPFCHEAGGVQRRPTPASSTVTKCLVDALASI